MYKCQIKISISKLLILTLLSNIGEQNNALFSLSIEHCENSENMENHAGLKSIKRVEVSLVSAWKVKSFSFNLLLLVWVLFGKVFEKSFFLQV